MKNVRVINLAETRDLLAQLDKARAAVLAGHLSGFHAGFRTTSGAETIVLGGVFKDDPMAAMRGILIASAAKEKPLNDEDRPPPFLASMM